MIDNLDFLGRSAHGERFDKIFVHGTGPDLFLATGCSWTRAWGANDSCLEFGSPDFKDDPAFMLEKSYAGRLARYLGFESIINMAMPGSSMDLQARFLVEFLQKNRAKLRRVFVLWGLTSHTRWELYSNDIGKPTGFQLGANVPPSAASFYPGRSEQMKFFLKHHWNETHELERYGQKIVMCHSYLRMLDIDHLFFPVFESFNQTNMNLNNVDNCNFFSKDLPVNDMLGIWRAQCHSSTYQRVSSNPFCDEDKAKLNPLIDAGLLSKKFAHPTELGHLDIFNHLVRHFESHKTH
jgi:hypothetical protein